MTTTLAAPNGTTETGRWSTGAGVVDGGDRPSILLISGWNLYNIGDVAITPGFLRLVQRYLPEARVTVLAASYPEELRTYVGRWFAPEDVDLLPMEFTPGQPLSDAMEAAFRGADLLVLNSGMTLSYGY